MNKILNLGSNSTSPSDSVIKGKKLCGNGQYVLVKSLVNFYDDISLPKVSMYQFGQQKSIINFKLVSVLPLKG